MIVGENPESVFGVFEASESHMETHESNKSFHRTQPCMLPSPLIAVQCSPALLTQISRWARRFIERSECNCHVFWKPETN